MVAPEIVITTDEVVMTPHTIVNPDTLLPPAEKVGVTDEAKKEEGYMSVIVPPEGMDVVGVNPIVTGTPDLPDTRSDNEISNETDITREGGDMLPVDTAADAAMSDDVWTLTPTEPTVATPIVNPFNVTENADVPTVAPEIVITTDVEVVTPHTNLKPDTLLPSAETIGVTDEAKKDEGYVSVIVPPEGMGVVGVNPIVTGTEIFDEMRSNKAISKDTDTTEVSKNPDGAALDNAVSHDVCTWIASVPGVTAPNVNPLIVNKDNAAITDSEVEMTTTVDVVVPHDATRCSTLLPIMTGVTDAAKNKGG
jgi:hypothetical protein